MKEITNIGKIIDVRIREIDTSTIVNTKELTLEESIEKIKDMCSFEEDKTEMNKMISQLRKEYINKE
jgi:UDP-N-acetylglucosamine:LPS N-acetylglucosamine transferase